MRFTFLAFVGPAAAFTPVLSYNATNSSHNTTTPNASPDKASDNAISLRSTNGAKLCGVTTVTVYETASNTYGAQSYPTVTKVADASKASPTAKVGKPLGYQKEQFHPKTESDVKLKPCNHWTHDAKNPKNLIPTSVGEKTQLYYAENGKPQPSNTFYFGIIDLLFKAPAVVLEQSAYITKAAYSNNQLVVDFTSTVACDFAKLSWSPGTILVSSSAGCEQSSEDDQCYFEVKEIVKSGNTVTVTGKSQSQSDVTEGGDATWGMYRPSVSNGGSQVNHPAKNGTPGFNGTTGSHGDSSFGSGFADSNSTGNGTSGFDNEMSTCQAPLDAKYGLPTACLGEYFDVDLDEALGYGELSADDVAFLREAMGELHDNILTQVARRAVLHRRNIERRFFGKILRFIAKKVVAPAVDVLKTAANVAVTVVKGAVELITTGTISGSIRESFSFALPDGAKAEAKQVDSPWGAAILIAAYGTNVASQSTGLQTEAYLNIFCVGCGAQGRVELAGHAAWSVTQGITQGELEAWADLKAALKLGVDAQLQLSSEWNTNLFQVGIPGLSFGVITIGPQVRLDSRVTLEASAEGRLLAGAELSWNRAYAKVDLVNPEKSRKENFDPVFKPTLEAEGEIFVGAELGLPIGLHFAISIASWKKTVALIDEPMIRGIAKADARAELVNGKLTGSFTATDGCVGIHTNLSWRNRLYGDVLGIRQFDILDTGYKNIKSACIAIGKQNQTPTVGGGSTSPATFSFDDDQQIGSSAPGNEGDKSTAPQVPSDDDATPSTLQIPSNGNSRASMPANIGDQVIKPQASSNEGDDAKASQDAAQDNAQTPAASSHEAVTAEKRVIYTKQSNSTATATANTNITLSTNLCDLTDSIKPATDLVSYTLPDSPSQPYTRDDSYEFAKILAGDGAYNLFYCSNGNIYIKETAQPTGLGCDELFVFSDDTVAGDGAGRYLYYHTNSMSAAGVSRLRLGDDEHPVVGTAALALVPWSAEDLGTELDEEIEGLYVAANYDSEALHWLVFCAYADGQAPKVFVVEDLDKGVEVLESGDVMYSVTGGKVDKCYALSAREDSASQDEWAKWDGSKEMYRSGLEFEYEK